jgi:hypothetical protein
MTNTIAMWVPGVRATRGALAAVAMTACGPVATGDGGYVLVVSKPSTGDRHITRIAQWARAYSLTATEVARLKQVLADYSPDEQEAELAEELRCVIAARKLAVRQPLTNTQIDRARVAFESGRTAFVPQSVE